MNLEAQVKDPARLKTNRPIDRQPHSLEGETFSPNHRRLGLPSTPSLTNKQITLDYLVHREIFRAIVANDELGLRSAWLRHQDVPIRSEEAISLCMKRHRLGLIPVILDLGGKPNKLRSSHLETLMISRHFDLVKTLVEAGAPINNEAGYSEALSRAIRQFHLHVEKRLDTEDYEEKSGHFDFSKIQFLLERGARMDTSLPEVRRCSESSSDNTAYWLDAYYSTLFSLFKAHGATLHDDHNFGTLAQLVDDPSPIEQAIVADDVGKVTELLQADPGILSQVKRPISKAIRNNCSLGMLQCLINNNCDVNEGQGSALLQACPAHGYIDPFRTPYVVKLLLERGADPSMQGAEAFINACSKFPESLGVLFFGSDCKGFQSPHYDAALRGLLKSSNSFPELGFIESQKREEPIFRHFTMVKDLVEQGADPYSATLDFLERGSLSPAAEDFEFKDVRTTSHYKTWERFLRERLSEQPPISRDDIDNGYLAADRALHQNELSLMQLGDDPRQRASVPGVARRYCHLMAQVLEPSSACWINSLIANKERNIPESMINPSLLRQDNRYKMLSDVAAITSVLHPPFTLRQRFLELARTTFSDSVKLKDSQVSNESVFEWLPTTKRLIKHFTDTALVPAVLSCFRPEALSFLTHGVLHKVREDLSSVAAEALFDGRSLREIRDFTKRWYALSEHHPVPISAYDGWNSVLQEPLALPNGFVVRDIHTVATLREIGKRMNNCLADGVHATQCFYGRSRILAIFRDDIPIVAMTLEKRDRGWELTEYEGPDYSRPDEGTDAPLTHFKKMLDAGAIEFNSTIERSIYAPQEYENHTSDGSLSKYSNFLDNNRTELVVPGNWEFKLALEAPGINAGAFYRRWVVLTDKGGDNAVPLLRDEAIAKCNQSLREIASALTVYLEYSEKLYKSYPKWAVRNPYQFGGTVG